MARRRGAAAGEGPSARRASRRRLLRRLAGLRNLEAFNILWFWFLFAWARSGEEPSSPWGFSAYGLAVVSVILAEGSYYWHLKLRSLDAGDPLPEGFGTAFARFRLLNLALLLASGPVASLLYASGFAGPRDLIIGSLLIVFAVLEHVNYFHVQLMHDSRNDWAYLRRYRRLRRSPLADDLRRQ